MGLSAPRLTIAQPRYRDPQEILETLSSEPFPRPQPRASSCDNLRGWKAVSSFARSAYPTCLPNLPILTLATVADEARSAYTTVPQRHPKRDLMMGPKLRISLAAYVLIPQRQRHTLAQPCGHTQRLYSSSVRLHPRWCSGLTAPDTCAARRCPGNGLQPPLLARFLGGWIWSLRLARAMNGGLAR